VVVLVAAVAAAPVVAVVERKVNWHLRASISRVALPAVLCVSLTLVASAAQAAPMSPEMKEGIAAYSRGDYRTAMGSLQGALSTEFNNATLHYYLGNCFVHMKQQESAIREFRIAYAISPEGEVGRFSKAALKIYGVDADDAGSEPKEPEVKAKPLPKTDPAMDQAIKSLRKQTFFAKDYESRANDFLTRDAERRAQEVLQKTKSDIERDSVYRDKRGRTTQLPVPLDSKKLLENLEKQFNNQLNARRRSNDQRTDEIQRSADNLENLLNEKRSTGTKLKPAGTNLFIRNYEHIPSVKPNAESLGKPASDDNPFSTP